MPLLLSYFSWQYGDPMLVLFRRRSHTTSQTLTLWFYIILVFWYGVTGIHYIHRLTFQNRESDVKRSVQLKWYVFWYDLSWTFIFTSNLEMDVNNKPKTSAYFYSVHTPVTRSNPKYQGYALTSVEAYPWTYSVCIQVQFNVQFSY